MPALREGVGYHCRHAECLPSPFTFWGMSLNRLNRAARTAVSPRSLAGPLGVPRGDCSRLGATILDFSGPRQKARDAILIPGQVRYTDRLGPRHGPRHGFRFFQESHSWARSYT